MVFLNLLSKRRFPDNISARFRSDSLQLINGTTLTVAGNITANGNIQGDGSTNISSINDITAGGDLTIDGVSDLDELTVAGVSTFSGNIFVGASLLLLDLVHMYL